MPDLKGTRLGQSVPLTAMRWGDRKQAALLCQVRRPWGAIAWSGLFAGCAVALLIGESAAARELRRVGPSSVNSVVSDGDRYVAYRATNRSSAITVMDTVTNRRHRLALPSDCRFPTNQAPDFVGGAHLILTCRDGTRPLVNMRTGRMTALPPDASFFQVGRYWVRGEGSCATECVAFFNHRTGERRSVPGADAEIDLNRKAFSRVRFCRPFEGPNQLTTPGSAGYDPPYLLRTTARRRLLLSRCGHRSAVTLARRTDGRLATLRDGLAVWASGGALGSYRIRDRRHASWRIRGGKEATALEVLRTRERAFVALGTGSGGDVVEQPLGYRLYSVKLRR